MAFPWLPFWLSCKYGVVHSSRFHSHIVLVLKSVLQTQNKSSCGDGNELSNDFKDHREGCSAMKGSNIRKPIGTAHTSTVFVSLAQNQL